MPRQNVLADIGGYDPVWACTGLTSYWRAHPGRLFPGDHLGHAGETSDCSSDEDSTPHSELCWCCLVRIHVPQGVPRRRVRARWAVRYSQVQGWSRPAPPAVIAADGLPEDLPPTRYTRPVCYRHAQFFADLCCVGSDEQADSTPLLRGLLVHSIIVVQRGQ